MKKVVIVGGGLAGLSAARELERGGIRPLLIEKSNEVGGRVATEALDGYLLDVGFQVLLDSYPEIGLEWKRALDLAPYETGARIKMEGKWQVVANPFTHPSLFSQLPQGSLKGAAAVLASLLQKPQGQSTDAFINALSADQTWLDAFLKPFFRGVLLDPDLEAEASRYQMLLRFFLKGKACLPKKGMQAIPLWLKKQLKTTDVRCKTEAVSLEKNCLTLHTNETIEADFILLALPLPAMQKLLPGIPCVKSLSTTCDYFTLEKRLPKMDRFLWLDGSREAPVNNFSFPGEVQPSYSARDKPLLSATALSSPPSIEQVQDYLASELGVSIKALKPLKRYTIDHALPDQSRPPSLENFFEEHTFLAGEAVSPPSINDAIASGKKAAEKMLDI